MQPCPISLDHLFLLITAFEGLSLWSAFGGLPNALKRINLDASWKNYKAEILGSQKREESADESKQFFDACNRFSAWGWCVRVLKSIPVFVAFFALVSYTVYPVVTNQSASAVFYTYWESICFIIAIVSLGRLITFGGAVVFFKRFERQYGNTVVFTNFDSDPGHYTIV